MDNEKIRIRTFGTFEISYGDERFNISQNWGRILVYIFELLVQSKKSSVSREMIISSLWPDNDNPGNVLNYSMFRLRDSLKKIPFLKNLSLIVTNKNTYTLNPEYQYEIDCELFEAYYDRLKGIEDISRCIGDIEDMLSIYQGDLYDIELNSMTMRIGNYYRFIYQEYMAKACTYYLQEADYDKVLMLSAKGSELHPYNEDAHYYYLKALVGKNLFDKALAYYDSTITLLEETYSQPISEGMRGLYATISSKGDHYIPITQVCQPILIMSHILLNISTVIAVLLLSFKIEEITRSPWMVHWRYIFLFWFGFYNVSLKLF